MNHYLVIIIVLLGFQLNLFLPFVCAEETILKPSATPLIVISAKPFKQANTGGTFRHSQNPKDREAGGVFVLTSDRTRKSGKNVLASIPYHSPYYYLLGVSRDGKKIILADGANSRSQKTIHCFSYDWRTKEVMPILSPLTDADEIPDNALSPKADYLIYSKNMPVRGLEYSHPNNEPPPLPGHDIYLVHLDKPSEINLTPDSANHVSASLSPDGQYIAYASRILPPHNNITDTLYANLRLQPYTIRIITRDGNLVAETTLRNISRPGSLEWDPHSSKIVFSNATTRYGRFKLLSFTITGQLTEILDTPVVIDNPAYSLKGQILAFNTITSGSMDIGIVNSDGSDFHIPALGMGKIHKEFLQWLPDNNQLLFYVNHERYSKYESGLYSMNSDGKNLQLLFRGDIEKAYIIP